VIETAALSVEPGEVERRNRELGLSIDPMTPVARWAGEVCDYGVTVEGLLIRNGVGTWAAENGSGEPLEPAPAGYDGHGAIYGPP
jgi:hypothetical protein